MNVGFILGIITSTIIFGHLMIRLLNLAYPSPFRLQKVHNADLHRRRYRSRATSTSSGSSTESLLSTEDILPTPVTACLSTSDRATAVPLDDDDVIHVNINDDLPTPGPVPSFTVIDCASPTISDDDDDSDSSSESEDNDHDTDPEGSATLLHPTIHRTHTSTALSDITEENTTIDLEQGTITISAPPPAYGRWRGSVRLNPDILGWNPVRNARIHELESGLHEGELNEDEHEHDDEHDDDHGRWTDAMGRPISRRVRAASPVGELLFGEVASMADAVGRGRGRGVLGAGMAAPPSYHTEEEGGTPDRVVVRRAR